jgi:hypothetical protein
LPKTQYTPGGVNATASTNDVVERTRSVAEGLDLLWGAQAIADYLGINRPPDFLPPTKQTHPRS